MKRIAADILEDRGAWPGMPDNLLPLFHWGCAIYSFVHCPSERIFGWDPNPVDPDDDVPFLSRSTPSVLGLPPGSTDRSASRG